MKRFVALAAVLTIAGAAQAELMGRAELISSNVATFDPSIFAPGPNVDVYHVIVDNGFAADVTSVELLLPGQWLNLNASDLTFKNGTGLPTLGPNLVAESFFVVPEGRTPAQILPVNVEDSDTTLGAAYTLQGGGVFVPASGSAVLAVLSVPTGAAVDQLAFSGAGVVSGAREVINFIPEPTAAVLAGLALVDGRGRHTDGDAGDETDDETEHDPSLAGTLRCCSTDPRVRPLDARGDGVKPLLQSLPPRRAQNRVRPRR